MIHEREHGRLKVWNGVGMGVVCVIRVRPGLTIPCMLGLVQ